MNKRLILSVLVLVFSLGAIACGAARAPSEKPATGEQAPKPEVPLSAATLDQAIPDIRPLDMDNPRYGGTFRAMTNQATPTLDSAAVSTGGTGYALTWVYEKLFRWGELEKDYWGTKLAPELAESWKVSDDLKTYTIKLRQGVKWQDIPPVNGREFVAEDVKFSFEQYMKPESILYSQFTQIASIEAPDKYTVVINLKSPNAFLIPDVQSRQEYIVPYDLPDRRNVAIGTGPFIIKEFVGGTGVGTGTKAVRNPNYWRKDPKGRTLPYLDGYEYISNPEIATKIAALRTKQIDMADALTGDDIVNLLRSNPDLVVVKSLPASYGTFSIAFKTEKAPWNDQRVRCAVSKAIDKEKMSMIVYGKPGLPRGPMLWEWVNPTRAITEDDLGPCYKYDPEGAKKLLAEAGFTKDKPLTAVRTYGHAGDWTTAENATYQQMLAEVGVQMTIKRVDYSTYAAGIYKRDFEDWGAGFAGTGVTSLQTAALNKWHSKARNNFSGIRRPDIDAKVEEIKLATDPAKQRELAKWLWDQFVNETVEVMLRANSTFAVYSAHTKNVYTRYNVGGPTSDGLWSRFPWFSDAPRTSP